MPESLPHVTSILAAAGLVDATWFTEYDLQRGSAVHEAARFLDEGDLAWETVHVAVLPRLRQYQRFLEDVKPDILSIEEEVRNETFRYCGRLDRRVRISGREAVIDLKGPSESAWNGVQLAGYAGCFDRPLKRYNLYLSDERYRLVERKDRLDWDVFKAALTITAWKEAHGNGSR